VIIVSISDLHIRIASRHKEYHKIFTKFLKQIKALQPDYIFNLGDLFHNKLTLSPESIMITRWFFSELSKICKVVSIVGNHDINLTNLDRPNSVEAVLEGIENQIILAKSQYVELEDGLAVGVFSILEQKETWPKTLSEKNKKNNINIALYHGAVNLSHDDSGFAIDNSIDSNEYFKDYDFVMCGDIHKAEQLDNEGRIWMTGNMIQQNFGESLDKGYLVWEIESKNKWKVRKVDIKNDYNYITVFIDDDDYEKNIQNISKTLKKNAVTQKSNVRIKISTDKISDQTFKEKIKTYVINEFGVTPILNDVYSFKSNDFVISSPNKSINFANNNVQNQLIQNYINESIIREKLNVEEIIKINNELNQEIGYLKDNSDDSIWEPIDLELSNIFCFGENIKLDFKKKLRGLVGLFGKNASGKSSLFNALTFAIFGKSIKKVNIQDILRHGSSHGSTKIVLKKGDFIYKIERSISGSKKQNHVRNNVSFNRYNSETKEWISLNQETIPETNKEITKYFGTFEDFLMTSMSTQEDYNLFINSGNSNRKDVVMKNLGLGIFKELYDLSNQKIKQIGDVIDHVDDTDILITKLQSLRNNIFEIEQLQDQYDTIIKNESKLSKDLENQIKDLSKNVFFVPQCDINEEEVKKQLEKVTKKFEDVNRDIAHTVSEVRKLKQQIELEESKIDELKKEIEKSIKKKNSEVAVLNSNVSRLEEKNLEHSSINCDRFDCSLLRSYKEDIDNLTRYKEELKIRKEELKELEKRENFIKDQFHIHLSLKEYKTKASGLLKDAKLLEQKIETYSNQLRDYENNKTTIRNNAIILAQIDNLNEQKNNSDMKVTKATSQKEVDKRLISEYEDRIEEINNTLEKIRNMKKKLEILINYKDIMNPNALPNILLNSYVDLFELEVNRILSSSTDLSVKVNLLNKKDAKNTELEINYMNSSRNPDLMPIELASGAEKMLLSLSIRVALINITSIQKSNILIVDEGFGTLHSEWIPVLKNLFESFKEMFHSIIIVSHLDSIQDLPNIIINVAKENNVSFLY